MHPYEFAVYGPFKTKVKGGALGINLLPTDTGKGEEALIFQRTGPSNPDDIDLRARNIPSAGVIVTCSARRIIELSKGGEKVSRILVAGNAEPTLHPGFQEITENLRDLRDKWFPKAKLCLLTRAVDLSHGDTRHLVSIYDRAILRFEWGTAKTFQSLAGVPSTQLKLLQDQIAGLDRLVVQASFRKEGTVDNASDSEVKNWIKRLTEVRPMAVQLTAPDSRTKGVRGATTNKLEKIAALVSEALEDVPVEILAEAVQPA